MFALACHAGRGKLIAESTASRAALGAVVPHRFARDLPVRALQAGPAARQDVRAGCREIHMIGAVVHPVARPAVAARGADCDAQRSRVLGGRVESGHGLAGPGGFGASPTDRNDRRACWWHHESPW